MEPKYAESLTTRRSSEMDSYLFLLELSHLLLHYILASQVIHIAVSLAGKIVIEALAHCYC